MWWYKTTFLDRQQPLNQTTKDDMQTVKRKKGRINALMAKLRVSQEQRKERRKIDASIAVLSKLSRKQLDDIGLIPADVEAFRNGTLPLSRAEVKRAALRLCASREICETKDAHASASPDIEPDASSHSLDKAA